MLTIEDYLELKDWKFSLNFEEGIHGEYYWVQGENLSVDLYHAIRLPENPYRVLVTYWDYISGPATIYGAEPGWRAIGNYALSQPRTTLPDLNHFADFEEMIIDNDTELDDAALNSYCSADYLSDVDNDCTKRFWCAIEQLNAYCLWSEQGRHTFVVRGKDLYDHFWNSDEVKGIEERFRARSKINRQKLWADLGPEIGPEKCAEPDCDRLRIRLAIRCFLHQCKSNK